MDEETTLRNHLKWERIRIHGAGSKVSKKISIENGRITFSMQIWIELSAMPVIEYGGNLNPNIQKSSGLYPMNKELTEIGSLPPAMPTGGTTVKAHANVESSGTAMIRHANAQSKVIPASVGSKVTPLGFKVKEVVNATLLAPMVLRPDLLEPEYHRPDNEITQLNMRLRSSLPDE
ncbi:hypothetical protein FXO38_25686 [Capsicum annuum]|nr:hypothetical protein FXO38_25686 [Capsicum annuum]